MSNILMTLSKFELFKRYYKWFKGEALEQANLVQFLELSGYKYTAIPNNTYTTSFKQKTVNTVTGLNPGLCDLLIILKKGSLLFIEMKKVRTKKINGEYKALSSDGISIKPEQKAWISSLNEVQNVEAIVCFGCKEAIEKIKEYENL